VDGKLDWVDGLGRLRPGVRQPAAAFHPAGLATQWRQGAGAVQNLAELFRRAGKSRLQFVLLKPP